MNEFVLPQELDGARLDRALATLVPDLSRSRLKALIVAGEVRVDGKIVDSASHKLRAGSFLALSIPPPVPAEPEAQDIPLNIVFEDSSLLVLDKPAGLVVHPAAGHAAGTLVNALLHHCAGTLSGIGGVARPGIVHRLDKDTSGLMLVAKTDRAHAALARQLAERAMSRTYRACIWGVPVPSKGRIDAAIARHPRDRLRMAVHPGGRAAATNYAVCERFGALAALVECRLESGRTHQIRVHMRHLGYPLVGDPLYGLQPTAAKSRLKKSGLEGDCAMAILEFPRQALHAVALEFVHPETGRDMRFESALPADLETLCASLRQAKS
ncbi:MAG: RluA family pseudouridine synthase [Rhodospirillales bacterium]|nr:RluA family pseudouridine synthase [Alphaproteobacteria bacterium]MCB9986242.1 RluA family pseudouridine synthase [Rhodospirillales bacterium]USO07203.1 MAG: RluA family pseudouridine synthase [Rhodospirillales bacterium]